MATTYTPNYNLAQPEVGGEPDTWGGLLNADLGTLDTVIKAVSDVANAALPKAGGTMTGPLYQTATAATTRVELNNSVGGYDHFVLSRVGGNFRWVIDLGDATTESGSNAGSNFSIGRYADNGAFLSFPVAINRNDGRVTLGHNATVNGGLTVGGGVNVTGAVAVTGLIQAGTSGGGQLRLDDTSAGGHYLRMGSGFNSGGDGISWVMPDTGDIRFVTPTLTGASVQVGNLNAYFGTFANQQVLRSIGWNNNVARWKEVIEADASYSLYFYDTAGTYVRRGMSIASASGIVSAADFAATSDERLKTEVAELRGGLERLRQMRPRTYKKEGRPEAGFIAQEAQRALPSAVSKNADGMLVVSHGQLQAMIAAAVLELDERLTAVEDLI